MKLLFIIFNHLLSNESHVVRLNMSLNYVSNHSDVSILCLSDKRHLAQERKYKNVKFYYHPIKYNWWEVQNIRDIVSFVKKLNSERKFDMIVQMMEIRDLVRELSLEIGKWCFSVVFHAMPFLGAPQEISKNFYDAVQQHCVVESKGYRKQYIKAHYKEFDKIMERIGVIAANPTVAYYLRNYCKSLHIFSLEPCWLSSIWYNALKGKKMYDFVYMARIEKWKGLDYLEKIFIHMAKVQKRKIKIAIMWNVEDFYSLYILERMKHNKDISVSYFGWCWNEKKKEILSKSKVFLYPSIYDTYSITLSEAVSIGLPCVVRDVLYVRINYSNIPYVWRIPFWQYKKFAQKAMILLNRNSFVQKLVQRKGREEYFNDIGESDLHLYINSCKGGKYNKL